VDAPWNRPEPWGKIGESVLHPDETRAMYVQNILDLRRGVDVLQALPGVDPGRIAYVGHSFGATWGGVLAAVEHRIGSIVLMGGLPSLTDQSLLGAPRYDEYMKMLQTQLPAEKWQRYVAAIEPLSGWNYVGHVAPCAIFFQFGTIDSWISRRAAEAYVAAASEPKVARWYPTSHEFNHLGATGDRLAWLQERLGLEPVGPILRGMLP
jgi:dienelactone hydrolase